MPGKMKKGQSIFIPFKDGESIYDSQNKARMYMSEEKFRASFPQWRFGEVELVEYVPKYSEAVTKWTSVEERLPEGGGSVLIYSPFGGVAEGTYSEHYKRWVQYRWSVFEPEVTHWMPLPEPPKEEV